MQLRLCRCGKPTENHPAVCDQCLAKKSEQKRAANRYYDTKLRNKQAGVFYHSKEWKLSRKSYLASIGYLCEDCVDEYKHGERREDDIHLATDVHHEEPIEFNWSRRLDPSNFRGLCDGHHKRRRVQNVHPGGGKNSM